MKGKKRIESLWNVMSIFRLPFLSTFDSNLSFWAHEKPGKPDYHTNYHQEQDNNWNVKFNSKLSCIIIAYNTEVEYEKHIIV